MIGRTLFDSYGFVNNYVMLKRQAASSKYQSNSVTASAAPKSERVRIA
jgi:hypothetical protein